MKKLSIVIALVFFCAVSAHAEIIVSPAFTKNLKLGMKNDQEVYLLQRVLVKQGFLANNSVPRGNYTTRTKAAVREFQRANFLVSDGNVGYRTRLILNKLFFENPRYLDPAAATTQTQNYQPQNQVQTGYSSVWGNPNQNLGAYYSIGGGYSYSNYSSGTTKPSIIVSYPTPGSTFNAGQGMGITWTASNFPNTITVSISIVEPSGYGNAVKVIANINPNAVNDGYEYWTIPTYLSGNNFYILIEAKDPINSSYNISAISSGAFTIVPYYSSTTTTGGSVTGSSGTTGTSTTGTTTTGTTTTSSTGTSTGSTTGSSTTTTGGTSGTTGTTTGTTSSTGSTGTTSSSIALPPAVISYAVSNSSITPIEATVEGYIDNKNLSTDAWVEYGTSNKLGITSSLSKNASLAFSQKLTGLSPNTTYYYKICAKNSAGTTCSAPILNFKTGTVASSSIPMADMVIKSFSVTPTALTKTTAVKTLSYSFSIKNDGTANLDIPKNSEFAVYKKSATSNTKIASYFFPSAVTINPGYSSSVITGTTNASINIASDAGTFDIVFIADENSAVTESSKVNNSFAKQIVVSLPSGTTTSSGLTTTGGGTAGQATGGSTTSSSL